MEREHVYRSNRRWENNIKMVLQEMGCEGIEWTDRDRDTLRALVTVVLNLRIP
jgi:hypothetical protein